MVRISPRARGLFVIDLDGLDASEVRLQMPDVYQHLLLTVKPERDQNREPARRENWWLFGRRNTLLRSGLRGLNRYIVTVETMKHRIFQFLDAEVLPDNRLVVVASEDPLMLAYLSSSAHLIWALETGGTLEDRPIYTKSHCFDRFPFPDPVPETLKEQLRAAAEELDATRKAVLEAHFDLTLTKLYNVLEKVRAGRPPHPEGKPSDLSPEGRGERGLTAEEMDIRDRGRVLILKDLHETIDRLTFEAYGWPVDLSDEEILGRLVALNKERAEEEAKGLVRWLRPEYQIPRFGTPTEKKQQIEADLVSFEDVGKPNFPKEETRRAIAISGVLASAAAPMSAADIAARFKQGKRLEKDIALTLRSFLRFGDVVSADGGKTFALRRVA